MPHFLGTLSWERTDSSVANFIHSRHERADMGQGWDPLTLWIVSAALVSVAAVLNGSLRVLGAIGSGQWRWRGSSESTLSSYRSQALTPLLWQMTAPTV